MAQDVNLFQQFNGRYDYVAIGNTMNTTENGLFSPCKILTESAAELNLNTNQTIIAAYLYWAGSGAGDYNIKVNGNEVNADRTFSDAIDETRIFFAAFADITDFVSNTGNGIYTISDFDLTAVINTYCPSGTNFGGWAMTIVYEDISLPLNQLNIYDGLQSVPDTLTINLDNLNVLDNENAKIGFIAWEGDRSLAVNEQLSINGNTIGNPPLNPPNNAFNGTNSFTGNTNLFNMDIDVYDLQNNISVGDTSASISLTSGQDFVMINAVITVLNSQLPDATIVIDSIVLECDSQSIEVSYTVNNLNSTGILPANTPIAFFADNIFVGQIVTITDIPIGSSENGTIEIEIPIELPDNFQLTASVDNDGTGNGIVTETNEINNNNTETVTQLIIPDIIKLEPVIACNEGFEIGTFNLFEAVINNNTITSGEFQFFLNLEDLRNNTNSIMSSTEFNNNTNPQTIYLRLASDPCYIIYEFELIVENCPPNIPEGFSPNNDTINDWFNIQGLYNVFLNHNLKIYNRYGTLIFEGDNTTPWNGVSNRGVNNGNLVPVGTYFYVLNLNEPNFKTNNGWVYVNY